MTKLHLSIENKKFAGVCGGLGESFGINPDFVRVAFLLSCIPGGVGILIYIALMVILPTIKIDSIIDIDLLEKKKRIYRSKSNKMIAGVCSGIGNYLKWDVSIIRIVFVSLMFFSGVGLPLYIIFWFIMPFDD